MRRALLLPTLAAGLAGASCGAPSVDRPDGGIFDDLPEDEQPPPVPEVEAMPETTPYRLLTINGSAEGRRVYVLGQREPEGGNGTPEPLPPYSKALLQDGSFCIDTPLPEAGIYSFTIQAQAQGELGLLSEPAGPFTVEYDPGAAPIPGALTCEGVDPAGCDSEVEICGNTRDDDCNGLVDDSDPQCMTCEADAYEPNDGLDAPRVAPGQIMGVRLCPDDLDFYGVFLKRGETLRVSLLFEHQEGNLDLYLLNTDWESVVRSSTSVTSDESVTYTATVTGEHKLRVQGESSTTLNEYTLVIDVDPAD